ncbi:MAG: hypothetical protein JWQ42_2650, partial [Edaphobacter sp.]|nr:hypothetical protein [Edaphobacter sp.]
MSNRNLFHNNLCPTAALLLVSPFAFSQSSSSTASLASMTTQSETSTIAAPSSMVSSTLTAADVGAGGVLAVADTTTALYSEWPTFMLNSYTSDPVSEVAVAGLPVADSTTSTDSVLGSGHGVAMVRTAI